MCSQESKTFFKKLKDTCKRIDSDVSNVKRLSEISGDGELGAVRLRNYQDKVKSLKAEANALKSMLEPKLAHTRDFIENFKELIVETEAQVTKHEEYLKQYGYKPLDSVVHSPPAVASGSFLKEPEEINNPTTPTLLQYGIVPYREKSYVGVLNTSPKLQMNSDENNGNSDTPTLDELSSVPELKEVTPEVPNSLPSVAFPSTPTLDL